MSSTIRNWLSQQVPVSQLEVDTAIELVVMDGEITTKEISELSDWKTSGTKFTDEAAKRLDAFIMTPGATTMARPAFDLATALDAAKTDGISQSELQAAFARLNGVYSARQVTAALDRVLPRYISAMDDEAVPLLANSQSLKLGTSVTMLDEWMPGFTFIDANRNQQVDENDQLWRLGSFTPLGATAADRINWTIALKKTCGDLARLQHSFGDNEFTNRMWAPTGEWGTFKPKAGTKPSDAVNDIFQWPRSYRFECATAMVIAYYKTLLDVMGPSRFDAMFSDLEIGPWEYEKDLDAMMTWQYVDGSKLSTEINPGDHSYFKNWDVSPAGKAAGWQGENVIYLGNGQYYGHPFGIATEQQIVEALNDERVDGSTRSASFLNKKMTIDTKVPFRR